jgi:tetratricopeptide (TPR) repeat protein
MLERAIELDPAFADAYAALAGVYAQEWAYQWSDDPDALDHAVELARRALALNDSVPFSHVVLAWHHQRHGRLEEALAEAEKAVATGPNLADPHGMLAAFLNLAGRPEEAIPSVKKAIRLEPHTAWAQRQALAESYRQTGRPEEAIAELKRAINENPDYLVSHLFLARVYAELGRDEEAKREGAEVLRISPGFSLGALGQWLAYKDPAETERAIHNLRKAGLKE